MGPQSGKFRLVSDNSSQRLDEAARPDPALPPFERALLEHIDALFAFAMHLERGRRDRAEDLVQDAALRAFRGYPNLRSPERLRSWLFRIVLNVYLNQAGRRRREPRAVDFALNDEVVESAEGPAELWPDFELDWGEVGGDLREALDALPLEFRTVVWLADVEEMTYQEIAEAVGCPAGTVASRLHRGHRLLRERLRELARFRGSLGE